MVLVFTSESSVFSIMAGLIAHVIFMLSLFITLCNGQNMAEYGAYWLFELLLIVTRFEKTIDLHTIILLW